MKHSAALKGIRQFCVCFPEVPSEKKQCVEHTQLCMCVCVCCLCMHKIIHRLLDYRQKNIYESIVTMVASGEVNWAADGHGRRKTIFQPCAFCLFLILSHEYILPIQEISETLKKC